MAAAARESRFLRRADEQVRAVTWDPQAPDGEDDEPQPPSPDVYAGLRHGDIVYSPDSYRADDSYVVVEEDGRKVVRPIADDSGYGAILVSVSALLEDPVAFYTGHACIEEACIWTIELDPAAHQPVLAAATGGRRVDSSRIVWWSDGALHIRSPHSSDIPDGAHDTELDTETPDVYLGTAVEIDVDPLMEGARACNKEVHEEKAHAYFLDLLPGARVAVSGLPSLTSGGWGGSETFVGVETDPTRSGRVLVVHTQSGPHPVAYKPKVVIDKGPYGGVAIWASEACQRRGFVHPRAGMLSLYDLGETC